MRRRVHHATRGWRIAVRAARTTPGLSLFVVAVVALVSLAGAAAPTLLRDARSGTVRAALADEGVASLDLTATTRGIAHPGPGPADGIEAPDDIIAVWGEPYRRLQRIHDAMPAEVQKVTGMPQALVTLDRATSTALDGPPRPFNRVMLTFDPAYEQRVDFVEGEAPERGAEGSFEVALSRESAEALEWQVGEQREVAYSGGATLLVLSGIFEPVDADDPAWSHVEASLRPDIVDDGLGNLIYQTRAFASPRRLASALPLTDAASSTAWFPLLVDEVDGDDAGQLASQLRGVTGIQQPFDVVVQNQMETGLAFRTSAPLALEAGAARASSMTAVISLVAVGPLAVAFVALALTGRMLGARRVASVRLAGARGASAGRLAALSSAEGLVLGIIGAAVGGGIAVAVVGAASGAAVIPALAAITPAVVLPIITMSAARRTARADLGLADPAARRRRGFIEAAIALASIAVVVLVATRGPAGEGVDPVLLLLPLALAALGCIVALRLVPVFLLLIEKRAPSQRGLTALVGPARARRDPAVRAAPVLAVVVGIAIALFSVAFAATTDSGIEVSSHTVVGADARVAAPYLNPELLPRMAALDGVEAIAPVYLAMRVDGDVAGRRVPVTVYVVDSLELAAVQTDPRTAIPAPAALRMTDTTGVPVVASEKLVAALGSGSLAIDDAQLDVVAHAPTESALGTAESWVMVDRVNADRIVRGTPAPEVVLIDFAEGADSAALAKGVSAIAGESAVVTTPALVAERLRSDPALRAVETALGASLLIVAVLLGFAVGMTLILGSGTRGRVLALLAALGYPRRRELPLVVWEVAPALLLALPAGILVGLAMPFLVIPALDLTRFVGGAAQPAIELGGWWPLVIIAGFFVLGVVSIAIATIAAGRVTAAATLRSIDEEG